ncbi:hypothetical protein XENOCAPTIV_007092 [Xenoophorus captivus]|uniref:Uncharacterized protein n=1 Tax=Xenoophorus captivus TaxID=1517983 RepID=A0ABV0S2H0_9TELE
MQGKFGGPLNTGTQRIPFFSFEVSSNALQRPSARMTAQELDEGGAGSPCAPDSSFSCCEVVVSFQLWISASFTSWIFTDFLYPFISSTQDPNSVSDSVAIFSGIPSTRNGKLNIIFIIAFPYEENKISMIYNNLKFKRIDI